MVESMVMNGYLFGSLLVGVCLWLEERDRIQAVFKNWQAYVKYI